MARFTKKVHIFQTENFKHRENVFREHCLLLNILDFAFNIKSVTNLLMQ